jgi:hypothetical protein
LLDELMDHAAYLIGSRDDSAQLPLFAHAEVFCGGYLPPLPSAIVPGIEARARLNWPVSPMASENENLSDDA